MTSPMLPLLLASLALQDPGATRDPAPKDPAPYVHDFELVAEGEFDRTSVPVTGGIVWYGTWEAAMAEVERTGKPVMLHMGSPRDRLTCIPGYW